VPNVKLQKQLSRKINGKEYAKYVIVIPPSTVEKLGWKEGQILTNEIDNRKLILEPLEE
jgi:bifunctional DNA-binding transcriptional regulator/antitoxin component of YhaV-PrlF toxin-antitoxin module